MVVVSGDDAAGQTGVRVRTTCIKGTSDHSCPNEQLPPLGEPRVPL